jgi:hypothetical protein
VITRIVFQRQGPTLYGVSDAAPQENPTPRWDLTPHGVIVDEQTFAFVTELETRKAARLAYGLSALAIRPQASGGGDISAPGRVGEQLARTASAVVRGTDLISVTPDSATVRVLLVGGELGNLRTIIQRITAEVSQHRFEIDGERSTLVLSIGGSSFPTTTANPRELLHQADTLAEEASREQASYSRYRIHGGPGRGIQKVDIP